MRSVAVLLALAVLPLSGCADDAADDGDAASDSTALIDSSGTQPADTVGTAGPPIGSVVPIFAWETTERGPRIEVIALRDSAGVLREPPLDETDSTGIAFQAANYARGTTYLATFGGLEAGTLTVDSALMAGCYGLPAGARFGQTPRGARQGIAYRGNAGARHRIEVASTGEQERARGIALARMGARVPASALARVEWDTTFALVEGAGVRTLVQTGHVIVDSAAYNRASVLLLVDVRGAAPRVVLEDAHVAADETENMRPSLFDAHDFDRDGTPELIVSRQFVVWWNYVVYRRGADGRWEPVYRGGGGGC